MTEAPATSATFGRVERFASIGSTNDVVRGWLAAGEPEICLASAGEQTAGRGRHGRTWTAPPGAALLCSLGFRPTWLAADRTWRLPATVALAMCDAAEDTAGLPVGAVRLKWPNDLVIETGGPRALLVGELSADAAAARLAAPLALRKLAGVLGETDGLGTDDPRVVVGIGINADWAAADFPPELADTMTSLREASAGRPIDVDALLGGVHGPGRGAHRSAPGRLLRPRGLGRAPGDDRPPGDPRGRASRTRRCSPSASTRPPGRSSSRTPRRPGGERLVHAGEVTRVRLATDGV